MLNIRNLVIVAVLAVVGNVVFNGASDVVKSGQNIASKVSARQAAINAALGDSQ